MTTGDRVYPPSGVTAASSTSLPDMSGVPNQTVVWTERGPWRLIPANGSITPDNIAYASASGGYLWERMPDGAPGATLTTAWYTSPAGDPTAAGTSTGSRIPFAELLARWGDQEIDGALTPQVTVDAPSDDTASFTHKFRTKNVPYIQINGARTDTSGDLTISARQLWAVSGQKDGLITVTGHTWAEGDLFHRVSDGIAAAVGDNISGGQAAVGLGNFIGGPAVNDVVRTHSLTVWSGALYDWDIDGDGVVEFVNIQSGTSGEVVVSGTGTALAFTDCYTYNVLMAKGCRGQGAYFYGGRTKGFAILDGVAYLNGPVMSKISWPLIVGGGCVNIGAGTLMEGIGPLFGLAQGAGRVAITGPVACRKYTTACIVDFGAQVHVESGGAMWMDTAVGSQYGFILHPGAVFAARSATELPSVIGTAPSTSHFLVGGTQKATSDVSGVGLSTPISINGAYVGKKT